jgi:activating signal cointegrator 1
MKALTISQPWASLIADGRKWVENRTWFTGYRGPLAIHAGKGTQYLTRAELKGYPTGCIIAVAELVACVRFDLLQRKCDLGDSTWAWAFGSTRITPEDIRDHEYTEGPWCWVLNGVRKIKPVQVKGAMGLWEFDWEA